MSETDEDPAADPQPASPGGRTVQYKGAPLEAERGPGLGCFWFQLAVLTIAVVVTPLSVVWGWPEGLSAALLFLVVLLLLFTGQTVIFLLRLVAADRRAAGRRRPLASATKTVGELDDEHAAGSTGAGPAKSGQAAVAEPGEAGAAESPEPGAANRSAQPGGAGAANESAGSAPDHQGPVRQ